MLNTDDKVQRKKNLVESRHLTSKPVTLYNALRIITQADNLENAMAHLELDARESTNQKHACLCGTLHGKVSYRIKVKGGPYHLGNDCINNRLVPHGFNAKVLGKLDAKRKKQVKNNVARNLEDLLSVSRVIEPLTYQYDRLDSAAEDMLGSSLLWLTTYDGAPESVRALATQLRDPFYEPSAQEVRTILKAIAKYKAFPADLYKGVMSDFVAMDRKDIADVFQTEIDAERELTAAQVKAITGKINYRKFRIKENQKNLNSIDFTETLQYLLPHVLNERTLRHEARKQELEETPVGVSQEYAVINAAFNRWFTGNQVAGVDALKVRKIAERIEPVKKLQTVVDRMTVLRRKLDYLSSEPEMAAPKDLLNEDCMTTETFKQMNGVSIDEYTEAIASVYSKRESILAVQGAIPTILRDAAYGLVRSRRAMTLLKTETNGRVPFEKLDKDDKRRVENVKKLLSSGLVKSVKWNEGEMLPELQRMAHATQYEPNAFRGIKEKLDRFGSVHLGFGVEKLPYEGTLREKLDKALADLKQYEGKRVLHWNSIEFGVSTQQVSVKVPEKTIQGITYLDGHAILAEREHLSLLVPFAEIAHNLRIVYEAAIAGKSYKHRASYGLKTDPVLSPVEIKTAKQALDQTDKKELFVTQITASALKDRALKRFIYVQS